VIQARSLLWDGRGFCLDEPVPLISKGTIMLRWAILFAILALIAGVLGFYGLEGMFASVAKILLFVFLVLFVVALIVGQRVVGGPTV
jgi:uncharacterized membrane protein YtjA (UPF0391 family)